MSKLLILLTVCFVVLKVASSEFTATREWKLYKEKFDKSYTDKAEEETRMKMFMEKVKKIEEHNNLYNEGKVTYKKGLNSLSDMTYEEIIKEKTGYLAQARLLSIANNKHLSYKSESDSKDTNSTVPDALDWRTKGVVTPVKNQKRCGSCWAFSAGGAIESQIYLKRNYLMRVSEQNLVDCSRPQGNEGCNGGYMENAFQYVIENNGIDIDKHYPYEGIDSFCRYYRGYRATSANSFATLPPGDENILKEKIANVGPISVAIMVTDDFFDYEEGVFYDENCSSKDADLNHGVLAVGYNTTEDGIDYWIVKNSWSHHWGDYGYIKMARNKNNACGIATASSYPIL